jgi:hypothetical protein
MHDVRPWPSPGPRPATPFGQAVLGLRLVKDGTDLPVLARDARVGTATAERCLHEGIDVIAAHAPELRDVLAIGFAGRVGIRLPGRHPHPHRAVRGGLDVAPEPMVAPRECFEQLISWKAGGPPRCSTRDCKSNSITGGGSCCASCCKEISTCARCGSAA